MKSKSIAMMVNLGIASIGCAICFAYAKKAMIAMSQPMVTPTDEPMVKQFEQPMVTPFDEPFVAPMVEPMVTSNEATTNVSDNEIF